MKVASGLASGRDALPELARDAVAAALAAAGIARAETVLLFLTHDFARHPQPALLAASRAAGCIAVAGSTVGGLFTEQGWVLDQPAAAALVIAESGPGTGAAAPLLSFSGHHRQPFDWQAGPPRAGLLATDAAAWSHGRIAANQCADLQLPGIHARLVHSDGLRRLGDPAAVAGCRGHELSVIGGMPASEHLRRALPEEYRQQMPPLHLLAALRDNGSPPLAVLAVNADGSLTLSDMLGEDEPLVWALRQPSSAEAEIRGVLAAAVNSGKAPDFALMFSCIGRGPLFYGDDDRDLRAFREYFPATPLLGAYGSGQIVPTGAGNRLFQNTVLTLLCESFHAV